MKEMKNNLSVVLIISLLLSTSVLAEPDQLDILGLIPDVSELPQTLQVGKEVSGSKDIRIFEMGRHNIPCTVEFINDKLADITCFTGKRDESKKFTEASNIVVHSDMKAWFTEKFGKPDSIERTRWGVEDELEIVSWKDKRGNKLQLFSMFYQVDVGMISLQSSKSLKHVEEMSTPPR
jgi:hypothetical protein